MSEKKTPKIYMSFRNNQKAIEVPNGLRTVIRKCIAETLRVTDFVGDADVSVTLVDNERIKRINKEFRDKNKVTDVISFPLGRFYHPAISFVFPCFSFAFYVFRLREKQRILLCLRI